MSRLVSASNSLSILYIAGGAGLGGWEGHGQSLRVGQGADLEVELFLILLSSHRGHGANFRGYYLLTLMSKKATHYESGGRLDLSSLQ